MPIVRRLSAFPTRGWALLLYCEYNNEYLIRVPGEDDILVARAEEAAVEFNNLCRSMDEGADHVVTGRVVELVLRPGVRMTVTDVQQALAELGVRRGAYSISAALHHLIRKRIRVWPGHRVRRIPGRPNRFELYKEE